MYCADNVAYCAGNASSLKAVLMAARHLLRFLTVILCHQPNAEAIVHWIGCGMFVSNHPHMDILSKNSTNVYCIVLVLRFCWAKLNCVTMEHVVLGTLVQPFTGIMICITRIFLKIMQIKGGVHWLQVRHQSYRCARTSTWMKYVLLWCFYIGTFGLARARWLFWLV